jgi:hypothetical protein
MTIKIKEDPYCEQKRIYQLFKEICKSENLYFKDSQTHYFSFTIIKLIPRNNKKIIDKIMNKLINGKYIHKYICDVNILEDSTTRMHFQPIAFQPDGNDKMMNHILNYLSKEDINIEVTYPCNYIPRGDIHEQK